MLCARLLQVSYSVRSERQLVEQIDCKPLFRWFVGLGMDDVVWTTPCSKNRDRLLNSEVAQSFLAEVDRQARPLHVRRALHRVSDADPGLGAAEELPPG